MYHVEEIVEPIAIKSSGISKSEFVNLLILYLHLSKDIWRFTYRYLREQVVNLFCFSLNLRFFNRGYSLYCNRINLLMRLPVPFVSFLKRVPLGYAAYSSLRVLRMVSFSQFIHKTSKLTAYELYSKNIIVSDTMNVLREELSNMP